ncbi:hypothetical protein Esti_003931 [Eimeria stiedai]
MLALLPRSSRFSATVKRGGAPEGPLPASPTSSSLPFRWIAILPTRLLHGVSAGGPLAPPMGAPCRCGSRLSAAAEFAAACRSSGRGKRKPSNPNQEAAAVRPEVREKPPDNKQDRVGGTLRVVKGKAGKGPLRCSCPGRLFVVMQQQQQQQQRGPRDMHVDRARDCRCSSSSSSSSNCCCHCSSRKVGVAAGRARAAHTIPGLASLAVALSLSPRAFNRLAPAAAAVAAVVAVAAGVVNGPHQKRLE